MYSMIDVHTHLMGLEQWGEHFLSAYKTSNAFIGSNLSVNSSRHREAIQSVEKAIVFGIESLFLGMDAGNDAVAAYANSDPTKVIGFMSVDPHRPDALEEIDRCAALGLRGIKLSPVYQDFHPAEECARRVHAKAELLGLPIITHAAFHSIPRTRMEVASPLHYDAVAREFPRLKIVLAHMGLPWFMDALVVARKHPNVYADVSPAVHRLWLYQALIAFQEFGVAHKLLFGSDFPITSIEQAVLSLRSVNAVVEGTGMPRVSDATVNGILDRDSISLLGLH